MCRVIARDSDLTPRLNCYRGRRVPDLTKLYSTVLRRPADVSSHFPHSGFALSSSPVLQILYHTFLLRPLLFQVIVANMRIYMWANDVLAEPRVVPSSHSNKLRGTLGWEGVSRGLARG
jgi:hypothetical protein